MRLNWILPSFYLQVHLLEILNAMGKKSVQVASTTQTLALRLYCCIAVALSVHGSVVNVARLGCMLTYNNLSFFFSGVHS